MYSHGLTSTLVGMKAHSRDIAVVIADGSTPHANDP